MRERERERERENVGFSISFKWEPVDDWQADGKGLTGEGWWWVGAKW